MAVVATKTTVSSQGEAGGVSAMPNWGGLLPASLPCPRVGNLGQGLGGSQDKSSVVETLSHGHLTAPQIGG